MAHELNPELLKELGLMHEEEVRTLTGFTSGTQKTHRKRRTGFPCVRIGTEYYYPISLAKTYVEELIAKKYGDYQLDDQKDDFL